MSKPTSKSSQAGPARGSKRPAGAALLPSDCAERLGCHVDHIYDLIEEGQLKAINIAGMNNLTDRRCCRVPVEALDDFLRRRSSV
ncbi:MAG: helix-turn-helix domain-containing protein [Verrucomicrobiia bacterium]